MIEQIEATGPVQAIKRRLSSRSFWSMNLAWMALFTYALSSLALDSIRLGNFSPIWLLIAVITFFEALIFGLMVKFLTSPKIWNHRSAYVYTTLMVAAIGGIKNLSVAVLAQYFKLETDVNLAVRFVGGMGLAMAISLATVVFFGTHLDHQETMKRLTKARRELEVYRQGSKALMQQQVDAMIAQTQEIITPRLTEIEELLEGDEPLENSVTQIRKLLTESVRPLSGQLLERAANFDQLPAPAKQKSRLSRYRELSKFQLSAYLHPKNLWIIFTLWQLAIALVTMGPEYLVAAAISALPILPALYLLRFITKRIRTKKLSINLSIMLAFTLIAAPASLIAIWDDASALNAQLLLLGYSYADIAITLTGGIFLNILNDDRNRLEVQALAANMNLERQAKRLEQELWLSRKRWSYMLHGKVQSILTIAINRLSSPGANGPELRKLTLRDFEKIRSSISRPPASNIDLNAELKQLMDAWRGVCDVRIKIDSHASKLLSRDSDARMSINEVAKEVVSNAFRHGRARSVEIQVVSVNEHEVSITAINDGFSISPNGKEANNRRGIGSQMLDEITIEWAIKSDRVARKTVFKALIAVDSNRAD